MSLQKRDKTRPAVYNSMLIFITIFFYFYFFTMIQFSLKSYSATNFAVGKVPVSLVARQA